MLGKSQKWAPYFFISPFFILFVIFGTFPILYSITLSFTKWTIAGFREFRGIQNYVSLLTKDPFFLRSMWTTFLLLIWGSILQHFFAIPLAIFLNSKKLKGRNMIKIIYFLPYITSTVVIAMIFLQLYDLNYGWFNFVIERIFKGEKVQWLQDPFFIIMGTAIMVNWRFIGWNTIIYLAGLQSIDTQLYEAAELDGATGFRKHIHITLPLLLPIIFFGVSLSIIGGMQLFEEPFILMGGYQTMGGPDNAGLTAAYYLLGTAFSFNRFGKASAIAWLLFLVIIVMTWINKRVTDWLQE